MDTELEITSVGHMMTQESFAVHDSACQVLSSLILKTCGDEP